MFVQKLKLLSNLRRVLPIFTSTSNQTTLFKKDTIRPVCNILRMSSSSSAQFQEALSKVKSWQSGEKDLGNDEKLKLYALYKQATEGPCNQKKPSMFDMVAKAKWEAWNSLGSMSQDDAKIQYATFVKNLGGSDEQSGSTSTSTGDSKYEGLIFAVNNGITEITFNRPSKRNAITKKMYRDIIAALKEASENDTAVTVLSGKGDFYSSGNDLSNFSMVQGDLATAAKEAAVLLRDFVGAFIDFPKVLVAAVNGPAYGIPVTLLGLCDVVYASDKAVFQTPFSSLGQSPEGCATYLFPKIMGYSKANEILMFNKKFTAAEAKSIGLVSEVFPHDAFHQNVKERLSILADASKQSMLYTKELSRGREKEMLHKVNKAECDRLEERWQSADCMEALMKFFQRKSKL